MTHFNHEWDGSPAIPEAVGDRYYAQDLNDDFNYLKHLPYEVFLQGRSRGVMIAPSDTWDNDTNSLTLSGGFGVILQDNLCVDPDENFVVPPITKSSPRYERIPLADITLILPNDGATHYIVATPTKRSLLQRIKTVLSESYASRIRYDGVITIQDTAPTAGQILIGLCHKKEYCLLVDDDVNQCKNNIILKKWFAQNITTPRDFIPILQSYYNTTITSIEAEIFIDTVSNYNVGINDGTFNNCTININTISSGSIGTDGGIFNNCTIFIDTINGTGGFYDGTFNNCTININTISSGVGISTSNILNNCTINIGTISGVGINSGAFNNCIINIGTINSGGKGIAEITYNNGGTFNDCIINISTINGGDGVDGDIGNTFNNCIVFINTISSGHGIWAGVYRSCTININTISSGSIGIRNSTTVTLHLTHISCTSISDISSTKGKLNVLNFAVLHTS